MKIIYHVLREVKIAHVNMYLPSLKNLPKDVFQFALERCFPSSQTLRGVGAWQSAHTDFKYSKRFKYKSKHHRTLRLFLLYLATIERIHSRGQQPCKFTGTKERFYIRKEFNSHRTGLVHQHGRRFIALVHQYGCRDVMCIRKIWCNW